MLKRIVSMAVICALAVSLLAGCAKKTVSYRNHLGDYVKTMDYHDGFTILQLTDIHWHGGTQVGDEDYGSERYLRKVINEAVAHAGKIDLIEVTGDTFMLTNKTAVKSFIDFMTRTEIPYAIIWGNHDRQSTYNPNWLSKQFLKAPYSLYTEIDNDDVHERSNYVINLLNLDGSAAWQITNLDSGASYRDGAADFDLTYDYLRDDQFEWMTAEHDAVGKDVPVICYYHIAQADYDLAWDAISAGAAGYKSKFFNIEGFAPSKYCRATEDICLKNNVKAVFIGHDHADDWTFTTPSGVTFGMGVKSGKELYYANIAPGLDYSGVDYSEEFALIGASLVTLKNASGDFGIEHLYLNERDEGDFVKWVEY
ncbi:MAG: metallophosphoesterase [Lachnospiraceae bacterium]|nr:metallophosphoesterase [Lachnospiraceae bacterium]